MFDFDKWKTEYGVEYLASDDLYNLIRDAEEAGEYVVVHYYQDSDIVTEVEVDGYWVENNFLYEEVADFDDSWKIDAERLWRE